MKMARFLRNKIAPAGWLVRAGWQQQQQQVQQVQCPFAGLISDASNPWASPVSSGSGRSSIGSAFQSYCYYASSTTAKSGTHHQQQQQRHMAAAAAPTPAPAAPAGTAPTSSHASASASAAAAAQVAAGALASSSADAAEAAAHACRLRELLAAAASSATAVAVAGRSGGDLFLGAGVPFSGAAQAASPTAAPQRQQQQHRKLDLSTVPMLQLRKSSQQQPAQPARRPLPPHAPAAPAVDWREIVERARRHERQQQQQQRLSGAQMLTDTFGRRHTYLRISLTERCNLRCTYCMPEEGVELTPGPQLLTADEVVRLATLFAAAGVDKIRLTGGEPTLRRDLPDIVARLAALPGVKTVAMTSNGVALARQLPALRAAGLSALNVSLDTLDPQRFAQLTRRPAAAHARVLDAISAALDAGLSPVKVNVVAMRGVNDAEFADFAALTRDRPLNVRFIEYMPFDGNTWGRDKLVPYAEMRAAVEARFPGLERLRDPTGEVAKNFAVPGHKGTVSFVTSMTHAFCGDCNRLRLLADGSLKVCLFGANEVSLRDALRSGATDDELRLVVSAAVDRKRAAHAGMLELAAAANRPMITIGG